MKQSLAPIKPGRLLRWKQLADRRAVKKAAKLRKTLRKKFPDHH